MGVIFKVFVQLDDNVAFHGFSLSCANDTKFCASSQKAQIAILQVRHHAVFVGVNPAHAHS
jgi:hypothetical protein